MCCVTPCGQSMKLLWLFSFSALTHSGDPVLLNQQSATSFLSRKLLANNWDFELVVKDNLERECEEEVCNYEEARECFEDDAKTVSRLKSIVSKLSWVEKCYVLEKVSDVSIMFLESLHTQWLFYSCEDFSLTSIHFLIISTAEPWAFTLNLTWIQFTPKS